jgi:hypothetical protein
MGKENLTTTTAEGERRQTCAQVVLERQESRSAEDALVAPPRMERPPSSASVKEADDDNKALPQQLNDDSSSSHDDDVDARALAPPALTRAPHVAPRIGAVAVAGPGPALSVADESDYESIPPPLAALTSQTTSGSAASTASSSVLMSSPPEISVTATMVTDDDYQAELHRVLMRTAVRASKVETLPEQRHDVHESDDEDDAHKARRSSAWYFTCLLATLLIGFALTSVLLATVPSSPLLRGNSIAADAPTAAPSAFYEVDGEQELVFWLKDRSFDGGEALREYASPQRTYSLLAVPCLLCLVCV